MIGICLVILMVATTVAIVCTRRFWRGRYVGTRQCVIDAMAGAAGMMLFAIVFLLLFGVRQ